MKSLGVPFLMAILTGCTTPHAVRVQCDAHLVPINASPPQVTGPVASIRPPSRPGGPIVDPGDTASRLAP
jgi:hypothetical protein